MVFILLTFGLIFGSFINALVWRLFLKFNKPNKKNTDYSILKGRSMCPRCKHRLSTVDLVPLFSWFFLRGKCRYCHKPISVQYPLVEFITGLTFVLSYIYWPYNFSSLGKSLFVLWLGILLLLVALAVYDFKYKILPNILVYILIVLSLLFVLIYFFNIDHHLSYLLSRILGILFSAGLFYLIFQVSKGQWIGGGDVKLCIALGLLLGGPLETIFMIFIASSIGCMIALILAIYQKI